MTWQACPHGSVGLRLRPPGIDLWSSHEASAAELSLLFMLMGAGARAAFFSLFYRFPRTTSPLLAAALRFQMQSPAWCVRVDTRMSAILRCLTFALLFFFPLSFLLCSVLGWLRLPCWSSVPRAITILSPATWITSESLPCTCGPTWCCKKSLSKQRAVRICVVL